MTNRTGGYMGTKESVHSMGMLPSILLSIIADFSEFKSTSPLVGEPARSLWKVKDTSQSIPYYVIASPPSSGDTVSMVCDVTLRLQIVDAPLCWYGFKELDELTEGEPYPSLFFALTCT